MKKFIIERHVPGAGKMTAEELEAISKTSVAVISILGKPYIWIRGRKRRRHTRAWKVRKLPGR